MDPLTQILISILASGGMWAFFTALLQQRKDRKDVRTLMLLGLGHDRIVNLCSFYLERGEWITTDEYENLEYLMKPYFKMKGNGTAEKLWAEVNKLRIIPSEYPKGGKRV